MGAHCGQGKGIFLISETSRRALEHTLSAPQRLRRVSLLRIRRSRREVDRSPSPSAKVKNVWSYTCAPSICLNGVDKGNCTFIFTHNYS